MCIRKSSDVKFLFLVVLVLFLFRVLLFPVDAQAKEKKTGAGKQLHFKVTMLSDTEVKLSWDKGLGKGWGRITRQRFQSSKKKNIRVRLSKGSYVDKVSICHNYWYFFSVKKNGKSITETKRIYSGVGKPSFSFSDGYKFDAYRPVVTGKYQVRVRCKKPTRGVKPAGYLFWRSPNGTDYLTIGTRKKPELLDKGAMKGMTYYYKVQAYAFINGKKYYGKLSDVAKVRVSNQTPVITHAIASKDAAQGILTIKVHSNRYNPLIEVYDGFSIYQSVPVVETEGGITKVMEYKISSYRMGDEDIWTTERKKMVLEPGGDMYMKLHRTGKEWKSQGQGSESGSNYYPEDRVTVVLRICYVTIGKYSQIDRYRYLDIFDFGSSHMKLSEEGDFYEV